MLISIVYACLVVIYSPSRVPGLATPWTIARQAPLSVGFSRQEYRSRLPCPSPGDLPNSGIEPASLRSLALAGRFFTTSAILSAPRPDTTTLSTCSKGRNSTGRSNAPIQAMSTSSLRAQTGPILCSSLSLRDSIWALLSLTPSPPANPILCFLQWPPLRVWVWGPP